MKTAEEIKAGLCQFCGTEYYYKHWTNHCVYTDGVKYLAETADCYWLLDAIASYRRKEPFQVWNLTVTDSKAVLTMQEDAEKPVIVKQDIEYTDFPLSEMTLWLIDGVILLPDEY